MNFDDPRPSGSLQAFLTRVSLSGFEYKLRFTAVDQDQADFIDVGGVRAGYSAGREPRFFDFSAMKSGSGQDICNFLDGEISKEVRPGLIFGCSHTEPSGRSLAGCQQKCPAEVSSKVSPLQRAMPRARWPGRGKIVSGWAAAMDFPKKCNPENKQAFKDLIQIIAGGPCSNLADPETGNRAQDGLRLAGSILIH